MNKKELEKLSKKTVSNNNFKININVNDEKELYNTFDKYNETLSEDLLSYINDKNELLNLKENILIEIIMATNIDEKRFIDCFENYCNNRLELVEIEERINITKMLYLLMIGMMFIMFSMILNNKVNIIILEIISTIGSFSIWESANSWFIERKVIRLNKLKSLRLKNSKIIFKYETK